VKSFPALWATVGTVAFLSLFVSACSSPASDGHDDHDDGATTSANAGLTASINDADMTFVTNMIPHHQQAIAMSALVQGRSTDPAVIKLAADISAAQGPEIEVMSALQTQWVGGGLQPPGDHSDMPGTMPDHSAMEGMVDEATMTKLASLKGTEFDTLWLRSMIGHHEGAIKMAQAEVANGANADAKDLAQKIVAAQQAEITQMKQMLGE
jgi:uncharacterized protein (DUF305 family)